MAMFDTLFELLKQNIKKINNKKTHPSYHTESSYRICFLLPFLFQHLEVFSFHSKHTDFTKTTQ